MLEGKKQASYCVEASKFDQLYKQIIVVFNGL